MHQSFTMRVIVSGDIRRKNGRKTRAGKWEVYLPSTDVIPRFPDESELIVGLIFPLVFNAVHHSELWVLQLVRLSADGLCSSKTVAGKYPATLIGKSSRC